MRSKTTSWFETKVRYDKTMEDGQNKKGYGGIYSGSAKLF